MNSVENVGMDADKEKFAVAVLVGDDGARRVQRILKNAPRPVEKS
jgi:hypothetical protein